MLLLVERPLAASHGHQASEVSKTVHSLALVVLSSCPCPSPPCLVSLVSNLWNLYRSCPLWPEIHFSSLLVQLVSVLRFLIMALIQCGQRLPGSQCFSHKVVIPSKTQSLWALAVFLSGKAPAQNVWRPGFNPQNYKKMILDSEFFFFLLTMSLPGTVW